MKKSAVKIGLVAGWALALVTGCSSIPSVGPDYAEPQPHDQEFTLPDAGSPTTNLNATCEYKAAEPKADFRVNITTNVMAQWWRRFDDPVLADLVDSAVSNNLSFLMAKSRLEQANWQLLGSFAGFLPKFGVDGGWSRFWNHEMTRSGGGNYTHYNVRNFGIDGSWEIDVFGGTRRLTESSFAEAEAAGWTVDDAWVSLTMQIGIQYINLRTTQELIGVARTNLVLQSETYDILKSRLDSGIGDELAVNQCAYVVEQTRARIPTLLAEEESLKNTLAILAGEMPGSLDDELAPVPVRRDWLLAPQKVGELKLDMMRARPDVRAAERALAAQTARIGAAKAQWFPKLFINGAVGWESKQHHRFFSTDSFFATLGPSVSWPIFQGGAIHANVKATEAKMYEKALDYEEAILNAYRDVRDTYSAYTQEYHRYQALAMAVKAATDAVAISKDLYKNGLKDFNNVLDAQRSRLEFEEQFALSRGQITSKLIALYRALGGGLPVDKLDD